MRKDYNTIYVFFSSSKPLLLASRTIFYYIFFVFKTATLKLKPITKLTSQRLIYHIVFSPKLYPKNYTSCPFTYSYKHWSYTFIFSSIFKICIFIYQCELVTATVAHWFLAIGWDNPECISLRGVMGKAVLHADLHTNVTRVIFHLSEYIFD